MLSSVLCFPNNERTVSIAKNLREDFTGQQLNLHVVDIDSNTALNESDIDCIKTSIFMICSIRNANYSRTAMSRTTP